MNGEDGISKAWLPERDNELSVLIVPHLLALRHLLPRFDKRADA